MVMGWVLIEVPPNFSRRLVYGLRSFVLGVSGAKHCSLWPLAFCIRSQGFMRILGPPNSI